MKNGSRRKSRSERGAAMMFALALVLIISLMTFGIATVCTQDLALAQRQRDSAAALNAAEAALNWELNKMARAESDPMVPLDHQAGGAYGATAPYGIPLPSDRNTYAGPKVAGAAPVEGTVKVWITGPDGASRFASPREFYLFAEGTVHGVTRSIYAYGVPVGLGDTYALYGIHSLDLKGRNLALSGYIGTGGVCDVQTAGGATLNGTVIFDRLDGIQGRWAGPAPGGWDWLNTPANNPFPPVDEVGSGVIRRMTGNGAADPLAWFAAGNDNETQIRALEYDAGKADGVGRLVDVKWPTSDHTRIDRALFDANDPTTTGKPLKALVLLGRKEPLLPNGYFRGSHFYLTHLEIPNKRSLEVWNDFDDGYGPVRLWLGPRGATNAEGRKFQMTDGSLRVNNDNGEAGAADSNAFTIYNGSRIPLELGNCQPTDRRGDPGFYGTVYAYNADLGGGYGAIHIVDDFVLRGSLIAWDLAQKNRDLDAALPGASTGGGDGLKHVLYYRLRAQWVEPKRASASGGRI